RQGDTLPGPGARLCAPIRVDGQGNGATAGRIARLHGDEATSGLLPFSLGTRWNAGAFELGLFGEAGRDYLIETSTNLSQFQAWTNVISTGTNWLANPQTPAPPQRFFRARTAN
ncbi:MAG: hypothetical protein Q7R45_16780, partial [Sulfuricaulis sp.]|nr:hypothetical protein [Sulfuricaulis sp.]